MSVEASTPVLSEVAERVGVTLEVAQGVLGDIPAAELEGKSLDHLAWIVRGQWRAAAERRQGEPVVVVEEELPRSLVADAVEHAGVSSLTSGVAVRVVTDDTAFVVDSLVAAFTARGAGIGDLVHPQMRAVRDDAGRLITATRNRKRQGAVRLPGHSEELPTGAHEVAESWVYLHLSPAGEFDGSQDMVETVHKVLRDVRLASEDWQSMRDMALQTADDLENDPPVSVPEFATADVRRFLHWLADDNFTFLGYREYELATMDEEDVLRPVEGTALGILRSASGSATGFERMTPESRAMARSPQLLMLTKANSRSRVHRDAYLDYVGVKTFDAEGNVTGERRFLGLHTARTYAAPTSTVPVVAERVAKVVRRAGHSPDSHSGRDLLNVLENYPRDELFQTSSARLYDIATEVVRLQERRHVGVFTRNDDYGRFVAVMVYLPRDRYNTRVREAIAEFLRETYGAQNVDYTARVSSEALARIFYTVRMPRGAAIPDVTPEQIRAHVLETTRTWTERVTHAAQTEGELDGSTARALVTQYGTGFSTAYSEAFSPRQAVADMQRLERLGDDDSALTLYGTKNLDTRERRLKIFRNEPLMLTEVFPIFTHLGVQVSDERPYTVRRSDGRTSYVYDFGLIADRTAMWGNTPQESSRRRTNVQDTVLAAWRGQAENDALNQLVLAAGLTWRQISHLRALARYMRQIGFSLSYEYVVAALLANTDLTSLLVRLFEARFDPTLDDAEREAQTKAVRQRFSDGLADVASLDHDRILRTLEGVIMAIVRTNAYTPRVLSGEVAELVFKIRCADVPGTPAPVPMFELWVYGPKVEGVHLRFGQVARGGLRWSDRFEDFRTEVLGLVKAQMVKNAVIVPTGSKGGFVAKQLPDPSDREAWLAAGVEAYEAFISGMLSVTDNRDGDEVIPPKDVVRYDSDDPYLVVAADKGTAAFSDKANAVARRAGFWLDDAFASGGSNGYDHKAMGITARGAWESVKRHFRELGHDTQSEDFTVVGVGDMSGDVFGNGMLLSEHIRLVAAFDHRDIFIDPNPDAATSYAERKRLFELPRSSWSDYSRNLISEGGGVFSRSAKQVRLTPQIREALGIEGDVETMTPNELMHAVLLAPADLFWNGGIGTYMKASSETSEQIGDRANDAIRVDGRDLRVRVIGEGGNLGVSQLGRIEAAQNGVSVNTDAIDNSAGVDSSDHEVNIKILLADVVRDGGLTMDERNELLASMTDEVAHKVLRHNTDQNTLLGNARVQAPAMLHVHRRLIDALEADGFLDRELEFLPNDVEIDERIEAGEGLTSPEFSVLLAYAKLRLKDQVLASDVVDDEWFVRELAAYFPDALRTRYPEAIEAHALRREIITNSVVNGLVNRGGITFVHRASEETGARPEEIVKAFVVAREVFDAQSFIDEVEALDNVVSTDVQSSLLLRLRRLLDRATRWFVHHEVEHTSVSALIERYEPSVSRLAPKVPELVIGVGREQYEDTAAGLVEQGVPEQLARRAAALLDLFVLLDITDLAHEIDADVEAVASTYFHGAAQIGLGRMLDAIAELPRDDRWDALARGAVRDDAYAVLTDLTRDVMLEAPEAGSTEERWNAWAERHALAVERGRAAIAGVERAESRLAPMSVALRTLRTLTRGTSGDAGQAEPTA